MKLKKKLNAYSLQKMFQKIRCKLRNVFIIIGIGHEGSIISKCYRPIV
jgi:hypothetical protein